VEIRGVRAATAVVATSVIAALVFPSVALAQDEPLEQRETVTVAAFKEVDIEPDIGTVSLGVAVHSRTADGAATKLSKRTSRVIQAVKSLALADAEIDTFNVQLVRTCLDRCRDPNPKDDKIPEPVMGYRGSAGVQTETSQLKRLGEAIDVGIQAGANGVRGITFDVSDKSAAVNEALRQAMVIATDKARILAETGGRQLGPAILITEGRTQAPDLYRVSDAAATISAGSVPVRGRPAPVPANPFPIEPPTLSASARVQVTFELN
jgi:uncharacterized protein